jgi:PAS domain S-box-containing protein
MSQNLSKTSDQKLAGRQHYLNSDITRAKIGLIILVIPLVIFGFIDYSLLGLSQQFYSLLSFRLLLLTLTLSTLIYITRVKRYEQYERAITAWAIVAVISQAYLYLNRTASFVPIQTILSNMYVLIILLIIPNRFSFQVISSLVIVFSEAIAITVNASSMAVSVTATLFLGIFLALIIGVAGSWQLNVYRWQNFLEIVNREKNEKTLKESEQLYRTLFDNSTDAFVLVEPLYDETGNSFDFRFLKVNRAFEHQTGAKSDDVLGKSAREVVLPLEQEWTSLSGNVDKTGKSEFYESYNKESDRWYDSHYFPYAKGQVGILFRDITERKKIEETLRESEEKFQNMIEQSPAIFAVYDKDGFLIQVNSSWDKLWEVPREYALGKYNILQSKQIREIGWLPFLKKAYAGETVSVRETEFDASLEPVALGRGRKRWLESIAYPIKKEHGVVTNIVLMHDDVTEKKSLEDKLQDNERMATIGQTAGMVGHDLRNPLQSIAGEVYLAKSELDSLPDGESKSCLQESIQTIEAQVSYMDKIVSDLQTFVKPVEAQMQIVNLKPLITALLAQTEIPKNIQANIEVQEALTAETDPQLLKRVLINLVTNAVQAMPEGGELTIEAQAKYKKVQIIVEDTGTGIPEEIKPKIFNPLFTTKSKGQGFGLAVCKRVIEAQHGTITFESQVGQGTKFIIELPINQ